MHSIHGSDIVNLSPIIYVHHDGKINLPDILPDFHYALIVHLIHVNGIHALSTTA